ncbi:MAG: GtrA family protein [Halobacteriaceae archaeon]
MDRLRRLWGDRRATRLRRFVTVGSFAAGVQSILLWTFTDLAGIHYLLSAVVAIEITILLQYGINNAWTFHRAKHTSRAEYLQGLVRTNIVRGTAIPLQIGALFVFVNALSAMYLIANLGAIFLSGIYRYALDSRWTWQETAETL